MYLFPASVRRDGLVWRWDTPTRTSQRLHLPAQTSFRIADLYLGRPIGTSTASTNLPQTSFHRAGLSLDGSRPKGPAKYSILPAPDKLTYSCLYLDYTCRDQPQPSPTCPRQAPVELICLEMGNTHREQTKPPRPGLQLFRHGPIPDSYGKISQLIYFSHWKNNNDRVRTTTNYQK
jgi:hypothetical protein